MSNITGRLRNASRINTSHGTYVRGEVYGDTKGRFVDGEVIRTSVVVTIEGNVVLTRNSIYEVETWAS